MYIIDFNKPLNVHFIGIGGISMSGLAEILHKRGFTITGSDWNRSAITDKLEELGMKVAIGHHPHNITEDVQLVIYTAAVKEENVEYIEARERNIPLMDRATLLGQMMRNYKYPICISGTHGKTTTTSMASLGFLAADTDPTISVGGILDAIGGNIRVGQSDYFLVESCEYCDSFLKFYPYIGVILNVEADHLDYFDDVHHVRRSFNAFAKRIPEEGYLVIHGGIEAYDDIIRDVNCHTITYGLDSSYDFSADNIRYNELGHATYDLYHKGQLMGEVALQINGIHNVNNSLSIIAIGHVLGLNIDAVSQGLYNFKGTKRRFEYKGNVKGIHIIDDYAHHPTEITATLSSAKKFPHEDLWVVFQPHTYTRTKALLTDFAEALQDADHVVITDIYAAREKNTGDIHAKDLLSELTKLGKEAHYFSSFDEIEIFLLQNCCPKDLLITMGAGDVRIIGEDLISG